MSAATRSPLRYLLPSVLLLAAIAVYGTRYWQPESLFWDENYHITSAQKHVDGVMYMEAHPPLGKMLMALAEQSVGVNAAIDPSPLLQRDHISGEQLPKGYRFHGMRLPSVLLMILSVPLLYLLILRITRQRAVAAAFTCLLIFDNALVVHSRAAMLEGIQIFFTLLALLAFAVMVESARAIRWRDYVVLGGLMGLAIAVKVNAAVLLLVLVALFAVDQWPRLRAGQPLPVLARLAWVAPLASAALLVVLLGVFYLHIAGGKTMLDSRAYKASEEFRGHVRNGTTGSLAGFTSGLRDNLRYMAEYSDGVPRLDLCKPGENGSHASTWPLGGRSINYRWSRSTVNGASKVSYLYLIGNPLVWLPVLLGVVLSVGLAMSRFVYGQAPRDPRLFAWIQLFTALYLAYLLAVLQIGRVMYLYHYLLPLVFGIVNLALVYSYLFQDGLQQRRRHTLFNLGAYVVLVIGVFGFFAPLTYGLPLSTEEFELRQWFAVWDLVPVK
ncbi:MAG: phospholipid carrier-dependent glycosyltransferase [Pseudomarimonas sp.]